MPESDLWAKGKEVIAAFHKVVIDSNNRRLF